MPRRSLTLALMFLLSGLPVRGQERATLQVHLPQDNAILTIDGVPTKQTGRLRTFQTPPLTGTDQTYTVKATWEPNNYTKITRQQVVPLTPGRAIEVDLRKADPRWKDDIVVRYVPTPNEVVAAMCRLAKVDKDDVVYDLGCGDGRMVILAVEQFGAKKGIGIDLDPQRVKDSRANAAKSPAKERLEFRQGDVLKVADLPAASVVLLYMGDDINRRLQPILQARLKPGARVVSHRFRMGDD